MVERQHKLLIAIGKLKELREKRTTVFGQIDELRKATDGRAMTAEEQQKWDALLSDYDAADRRVKQEESFQEMEMIQLRQSGDFHQERGIDVVSVRSGMGITITNKESETINAHEMQNYERSWDYLLEKPYLCF